MIRQRTQDEMQDDNSLQSTQIAIHNGFVLNGTWKAFPSLLYELRKENYIEDITQVVILYEIYQTSLWQV